MSILTSSEQPLTPLVTCVSEARESLLVSQVYGALGLEFVVRKSVKFTQPHWFLEVTVRPHSDFLLVCSSQAQGWWEPLDFAIGFNIGFLGWYSLAS